MPVIIVRKKKNTDTNNGNNNSNNANDNLLQLQTTTHTHSLPPKRRGRPRRVRNPLQNDRELFRQLFNEME